MSGIDELVCEAADFCEEAVESPESSQWHQPAGLNPSFVVQSGSVGKTEDENENALVAVRSILWRLLPLAIAATVLIGIFVSVVRTPGTASANIAAEKVARPIADLQILNEQSRRTNEMMLQTHALDLRTLQFELKCIEHFSPTGDTPQAVDGC